MDFTQEWDNVANAYALTFGKKDFEKEMHNQFSACPVKSIINNSVTTLSYTQDVDFAEAVVTGAMFKLAPNVPKCEKDCDWEIVVKPGETYYHMRTIVTNRNRGSKCKIHVDLDQCFSTNGNLIVLENADGPHNIEYWCGGNSTGRMRVEFKGNSIIEKHYTVQTNFLPHRNTLRNALSTMGLHVTVEGMASTLSGFGGSVAQWFHGLVGKLGSLITGMSLLKTASSVVCLFVAYMSLMRGSTISAVIWVACKIYTRSLGC